MDTALHTSRYHANASNLGIALNSAPGSLAGDLLDPLDHGALHRHLEADRKAQHEHRQQHVEQQHGHHRQTCCCRNGKLELVRS